MSELPIIQKTYDLLKWYIPILKRLPKNFRFSLGTRISERLYGVLETLRNLTSQFFANFYLNGFDHLVKEQLQVRKYVRYVDDFALFSDDYQFLKNARMAITKSLGLRI